MKRLLLILFLFACAITDAQIVNIPDEIFKSILLNSSAENFTARDSNLNFIAVDANANGEVEVSEAENVWELNLIGSIYSLDGITSFTNLRYFNCYTATLSEPLSLSSLTHLEYLDLRFNSFTSLDLHGLANLKEFRSSGTPLSELNLQGLTNLLFLDSGSVSLSSLDMSDLVSVTYVNLPDSPLSELDVSNLSSLEYLNCAGCNLSSLDVTNNLALFTLQCSSNPLEQLELGSKPALQNLYCNSDRLTSLDISGCPRLTMVSGVGNDFTYLNLKNGIPTSFYGGLETPIETYLYICADEGEEEVIRNSYSALDGYVNINSYCSFTPGGNYNTIAGTFTYDSNNDGCDAAENTFALAKISINDGAVAGSSFTGSNGGYNFYTQSGNFVIIPQFENNWFTANPTSVTINLSTVDSTAVNTHNFCITSNGTHPDVEVVIIPLVGASPGFDATYKIVYKNKGNQTLSGDVVFTYNDDVLDYVYASATPSSTATGSLTWSYTNLLPFETREIVAVLNTNGPMETPAVNIDDVLNFSAAITPATGDETPEDNIFNLNEVVVGSFDPNDITCLEGAMVSPDKIGEYLHYNINFENTGTAAATFIVVKDIIDASKFDVNTLQILDSSHAMETRVNGNKVEFIFDDINLGAAEKGNVTFKIKTLETLAVNSEVTQQADIFFDYNWPIQTNEATTTFAILSAGDFKQDNSVKVYPNPADGIVTISAKAEITSVQLYDVQGRLLQSGSGNTLDISNRQAGIYFVKVMTDKGVKVEKLVRN